jgi:hypothetical protein
MDAALELMALGGLMKQAVSLIRGVEIRQGGGRFVFSVVSVVPWFKARGRDGAGRGGLQTEERRSAEH